MTILKRSASLSQYVVTERIKNIGSHMGCTSNSQYLPISYPSTTKKAAGIDIEKEQTRLRFPEVWRDRYSASIRLASTPEAKSLNSL